MDRFEDLSNFAAIIEAGGISAAADRLDLSKSVVSRRLKLLEARLGTQLIVRTTRTQRVTNEGQFFYERCKQILADLEEAETSFTKDSTALTGSVRLTAPAYFGQKFIAPVLSEFISEHDGIVVDIDLSDRHVNLVDEGFDLAVRIGKLPDSTLVARRLTDVDIHVCASPDYLAVQGEPKTIHDLSKHYGLIHRSGVVLSGWTWVDDAGHTHYARTKHRMISNDDDVLRTAACEGLGLICMPSFAVDTEIEAGRLQRVLADVNWESLGVYAVYPHTRHLSKRVRAFVDFLVARFG